MYVKIQLSVLSYLIEISVFLSVVIAGLRFTVDGGGEPKKISIYHVDITKRYISKIKRVFSGNRKLATVNPINMLNNTPVLFSIPRDSIELES